MAQDRNQAARQKFSQRMAGKGATMEPVTPMDGEEPGENLTPQEKQIIDQAKEVAGQMLYGQAAKPTAKLIGSGNPAKGCGEAAAQITAATDKKMDLPEDLIIPVGMVVLEMVIDLGESLGLLKEDDKLLQNATREMNKRLFDEYPPDAQDLSQVAQEQDPAELQNGMAQQAQMQQETDGAVQ